MDKKISGGSSCKGPGRRMMISEVGCRVSVVVVVVVVFVNAGKETVATEETSTINMHQIVTNDA